MSTIKSHRLLLVVELRMKILIFLCPYAQEAWRGAHIEVLLIQILIWIPTYELFWNATRVKELLHYLLNYPFGFYGAYGRIQDVKLM